MNISYFMKKTHPENPENISSNLIFKKGFWKYIYKPLLAFIFVANTLELGALILVIWRQFEIRTVWPTFFTRFKRKNTVTRIEFLWQNGASTYLLVKHRRQKKAKISHALIYAGEQFSPYELTMIEILNIMILKRFF